MAIPVGLDPGCVEAPLAGGRRGGQEAGVSRNDPCHLRPRWIGRYNEAFHESESGRNYSRRPTFESHGSRHA
jgi:hypothetical protein